MSAGTTKTALCRNVSVRGITARLGDFVAFFLQALKVELDCFLDVSLNFFFSISR